ncbi:MAG: hypothetical protein WCJ01_06730 [Ignavibacteria bacterium]
MELETKTYSYFDEAKKWLPSVIMLPVIVYLVINRGIYTMIDNADLVIHEGGHIVFMIFGSFIYTAGGTLMQILLPSLIIFYFFRNFYKTGIQVSMLWLGQNLINISVYAADARAHKLRLLGNGRLYHDWTYLLSHTGLLEYDTEVGYFFFGLAILVFLAALILPYFIE